MSGMQNLHRITGSVFVHEKPNLCPFCVHRRDYGEWQGFCTEKRKIISAPNVEKGRCKEFERKIEMDGGEE